MKFSIIVNIYYLFYLNRFKISRVIKVGTDFETVPMVKNGEIKIIINE